MMLNSSLGVQLKKKEVLCCCMKISQGLHCFSFVQFLKKNYILDESNQGLCTKRETVTIKLPQRKKKF